MREGPSYRHVTGSSGRRPWFGLIAVVALVAVAIVKPWGEPVPLPRGPSSLPRVLAEGTPAPPAVAPPVKTAAELAVMSCPGTLLWMVHSFQRRGSDTYNVWTVAKPVPAASADPATMMYTPIYASQIMAFGYCAPGDHDLRPQAKDDVTIWRVDGHSLIEVPAVAVDGNLRPDFGALLGPSSAGDRVPGRPGWPAGRYLIRVGAAVLGAEVVLF